MFAHGEGKEQIIDLIGVERKCVVFVEVKTRRHTELGLPVDAVDSEKIRRISKTARPAS